jgi:azurin
MVARGTDHEDDMTLKSTTSPLAPRLFAAAALALSAAGAPQLLAQDSAGTAAPQVFLDKSPKIVAFQLKRLSNQQLLAVERKTDHPKYKPVYEAILVRGGIEKRFRSEAAEGLAALNKSDPVVEILNGIGRVEKDDAGTLAELVGLLLTQEPKVLAGQRAKIEALANESQSTSLKEAAYGALVVAEGKPDAVWAATEGKPDALAALLGSVSMLPNAELKEAFYSRVKPLSEQAPDEPTRVAAIDALGFIPGHEPESFALLAGLLQKEQGDVRAAAVRSLRRIPAEQWPAEQVAPLAQAIVKLVAETPSDQRATPALIETIQLGEELAGKLPADQGTPIRKSLRELGVRTILVRTLKEQMAYDLRYFVVQAGKPVQVVLDNPDAMPHNFVVTAPGALQEVGVAGGSMQPPSDPKVKAFIPDSPKVLHASHLVPPGKSETISFEAPTEPGEYPYVCTYPGHWVRMYGVMLVVPDLDAYDASPVVPADPISKKPFESQKQTTAAGVPDHQHAH